MIVEITKVLMFAALLATALVAPTHSKEPNKPRCIHLNEAMEKEYGYCAAVDVGGFLYVSGTVGSGEMKAAMKQAYDDIQQLLSRRGLDFSDVVRETVFTIDLDAFSENRNLRKSYYKGTYPAASWVKVSELYGGKYTVEIEVTAKFKD